MNNVTELRTELANVFAGVKDGSLEIEKAEAMNNTAGKILKSLAVELSYFNQIKQVPSIAFFGGASGFVGNNQTGAVGADPALIESRMASGTGVLV